MTQAPALPAIRIESVRRLFDDGCHNAFTDLCRYRDRFYLCFRSSPTSHEVLPDSSIVVLSSDDGQQWETAHRFSVPGRDVRDPHFLEFGGRLLIYSGTWLCDGRNDLADHLGYAAWTDDGQRWQAPVALPDTQGTFVWRCATHGGKAYLCAYARRHVDVPGTRGHSVGRSQLMVSDDGFAFRAVGDFEQTLGNETAFLFEPDGEVVAINRQRRDALLCRSRPPYRDWTRTSLGRYIGGPMIAKWGERTLVGGRKFLSFDEPDKQPRMVLSWLVEQSLVDMVELPSGGDTAYPGFVPLSPTRGLLSYYSSHEGSGGKTAPCSIYLAQIGL